MAGRGIRAPKLTDEHRKFIVREIAAFETPQRVAELVKEEFGIEITRQNIEHYDPRKNKTLARKWREHHELSRKAFRERIEDEIPSANKFVRVRRLDRIAQLMGKRNNFIAEANVYEQIAKEVGNVHTNRREFTGKEGGPVQLQDVTTMTPEQVNAELAAYMRDPNALAFVLSLAQSNEETPAIPPALDKETK